MPGRKGRHLSDEQVAALLLQTFLRDPVLYANGISACAASKACSVNISRIKEVARSYPADFALYKSRVQPGRAKVLLIACLAPAFQSQVPPSSQQQQQQYSQTDGPLYCKACNLSFPSSAAKEAHVAGSRHRATVLLQQLRASGSIHANTQGLQVSEFDERDDLQIGEACTMQLVVTNVSHETQTLQGLFQVRPLVDVELPKHVAPCALGPGQYLTLNITVRPRNYGILCSLIVLDFGVLIARELRVGCTADTAGINLGPSAPYTGPKRVRLSPQEAPFVPGEKPPKSRVVWQKPPRPWKVPDRLRRLVAEGQVQEVQSELDAYKGKTDIHSHLTKMHLLLHLEELQQELDVRTYDMQGVELLKSGRDFLALEVPGLAESRPSVMKGDALYVSSAGGGGGGKEWQGFVHYVQCEQVLLKFHRSFVHLPGMQFNVRFAIKRTAFVFQHQALEVAAQGLVAGSRHELLLPPKWPPPVASNGIKMLPGHWVNRKLNEEQQAAVQCVVEGRSGALPFIIWGPPGTGKTTTLIEAAVQVLRLQPSSRLLLVAPSNTAADMLAERMLDAGTPKSSLLRVCAYARPKGDLLPKLQDVVLWDDVSGAFSLPSLDQVLRKRVLALTPIMAAKLYALGVPRTFFTHIMMDEAGHAEEPLALCALSGLVGADCSVTLAGDPKQLGPIVHSRLASAAGLGLSLLERLTQALPYASVPGLAAAGSNSGASLAAARGLIVKLVRNYRSHPDLLALPSRLFYGGELQAYAHPDDTDNLLHFPQLPNNRVPLLFHSIVGKEEREANSPSWFNVHEALVVVKYIQSLMDLRRSRVTSDQIGVITPYRKQVQRLQRLLQAKGLGGVQVGSVEQFQGSERRVVIISTVRSSPQFLDHDFKHKLGFVASPKRFNVAITRAKALLIVIGNPAVLRRDPHWLELLRLAQSHACCVGQPMPDLTEPASEAAAAADAGADSGSGQGNGSGGTSASAGLHKEIVLLEQLMGSMVLSSTAASLAAQQQALADLGISGLVAEGAGGMVRHD